MKTKSIIVLFALMAFSTFVNAEVYSGNCGAEGDGSNLLWSFNSETGVLDITGSGAMAGYYGKTPGWGKYKTSVVQINLPSGLTKIGDSAFRETNVTSITIPNTVTVIEEMAFLNCKKLQSISFSNTLESIGYDAFGYCSQLKEINFPNSLITIGSTAFNACTNLTNITIPNSVKTIASYAFEGCTGLISVTIGTGVISIGDFAFSDCTGLTALYISDLKKWCEIDFPHDYGYTSTGNPLYYANKLYLNGQLVEDLVIPDGITEIKGTSFCNATCLKSITIPSGVTSIGMGAFSGCEKATSVSIPNTVTTIETAAFEKCKSLPAVSIPSSVKTIYSYAFSFCTSLNDLQLSNGIETMGSNAFGNCSTLVAVIIPESVVSMHYQAFTSCTKLATITWNAIHCEDFTTNSPFLYCTSMTIGNKVEVLPKNFCYKSNKLTSVIIPNSVTEIRENAFRSCSALYDVTIGKHVSVIGNSAFYQCSVLDTVIVPNSVMELGTYTFYGCKQLKHLVLPNQLTQIGENLCNGCSVLETITIPSAIQTIGQKAFYDCKKLKVITSEALIPPACGSTVFGNVDNSTPLYVPAASIEAYKTADQWQDFLDIRPIGDIYRVTFVDYDGQELYAEYVDGGNAATAPANPKREGYTFIGWDKAFDNVTEYMTVTAQYAINRFAVKFLNWNDTILKIDSVDWHGAAVAPENPICEGYSFTSWNKKFDDITADLVVKAQFTVNYYDVFFLDYEGSILKQQSVKYNTAATAPKSPTRDGYTFKGWSGEIAHVNERVFAVAQYEPNQPTFTNTITYKDKDGGIIFEEGVNLNFPNAPEYADFTFLCWMTVEGNASEGIVVKAVYQNNIATSTTQIGDASSQTTQKILHDGQIYILRGNKTYTLQGQEVK